MTIPTELIEMTLDYAEFYPIVFKVKKHYVDQKELLACKAKSNLLGLAGINEYVKNNFGEDKKSIFLKLNRAIGTQKYDKYFEDNIVIEQLLSNGMNFGLILHILLTDKTDNLYIDSAVRLFYIREGLEEIDISDINLCYVRNFQQMFNRCRHIKSIKINVDSIDKIDNAKEMFMTLADKKIDDYLDKETLQVILEKFKENNIDYDTDIGW